MRLRSRAEEAPAEDVQLLSFDPEMSQAMADGISTIWQIQGNVHRLKEVRNALGDQAAGSSIDLNDRATEILTSTLFDTGTEASSGDPSLRDGFFESAAEAFSEPDKVTNEALSKLGHLAVLIGAETKIIEKLDQEWQEEFASRIVGHEVLIWKPAKWDHTFDTPGGYRYSAPYYSSRGNGFSTGKLGRESVVTGTVAEISLRKNGTVTLADGIKSYNSIAAYTTAPTQVAGEAAEPWDRFGRLEANGLFQSVRDSKVPHPRIKIEEV
jgi:hypothetical protein